MDYKITLIYSNRDKKSIAFLKELKKMEDDNFKLVLTKIVDEQIIKNLPEFKSSTYYISGPPKMVESINTVLTSIGIEDIKTDEFTGY